MLTVWLVYKSGRALLLCFRVQVTAAHLTSWGPGKLDKGQSKKEGRGCPPRGQLSHCRDQTLAKATSRREILLYRLQGTQGTVAGKAWWWQSVKWLVVFLSLGGRGRQRWGPAGVSPLPLSFFPVCQPVGVVLSALGGSPFSVTAL